MKQPTRNVIDLRLGGIIFLGDFSHTLLVLHAMFRTWMGNYFGIPTSRVSMFKLGRVFALFPRLTQERLTKAVAIIVQHDSPALRRQSVRGSSLAQRPLACEDGLDRYLTNDVPNCVLPFVSRLLTPSSFRAFSAMSFTGDNLISVIVILPP